MHKSMEAAFANVSAGESLKEQTLLAVKKRTGSADPRIRTAGPRFRTAPGRLRPILAACLVFVLVFGSLGSYHVYETEAALISIDINPSIELEVNRFGRVISQTGYGTEGVQVLEDLSLKNLTYAQALEALLISPALEPYLTEGATVRVTLGTADTGDSAMLKELESCVNQVISTHHQGVSSSYCHVDMEEAEAAHEEGLSMGRYCASHHGESHAAGHGLSEPAQTQSPETFPQTSGDEDSRKGQHSHHRHMPEGCHD